MTEKYSDWLQNGHARAKQTQSRGLLDIDRREGGGDEDGGVGSPYLVAAAADDAKSAWSGSLAKALKLPLASVVLLAAALCSAA